MNAIFARKLLALGDVEQYLSRTTNSEQPLLGLTVIALYEALGIEDQTQLNSIRHRIQRSIIPDLERRIKDKCRLLCDITQPIQNTEMTSLPLAHAEQLPVEILKVKSMNVMLEKDLTEMQEAHDIRVQEMSEKMKKYSQILQETIKLRDQSQFMSNKIISLEVYISAMQKKIELLVKQLQVETYSETKIKALHRIHQKLVERHDSSLQFNHELQAKLRQYEQLGPSFVATADQFTQTQKKISEKEKWIASLDV
ncbi:hypothetical protein THRCLA_21047 [Thraustotheca clavata]|uniref:Uncharacterized protein n=1 Tax=Thraustotheca clavata TaxID=74557 RepID=A0A1W0A0P9_9STRA|nr:hypothetical protein THRCLA_21047 [Thraustotheca clavata]